MTPFGKLSILKPFKSNELSHWGRRLAGPSIRTSGGVRSARALIFAHNVMSPQNCGGVSAAATDAKTAPGVSQPARIASRSKAFEPSQPGGRVRQLLQPPGRGGGDPGKRGSRFLAPMRTARLNPGWQTPCLRTLPTRTARPSPGDAGHTVTPTDPASVGRGRGTERFPGTRRRRGARLSGRPDAASR